MLYVQSTKYFERNPRYFYVDDEFEWYCIAKQVKPGERVSTGAGTYRTNFSNEWKDLWEAASNGVHDHFEFRVCT